MVKANQDVRGAIAGANEKHWHVAYALGISDGHFARLLRKELPNEMKQRIFTIIQELRQAQ